MFDLNHATSPQELYCYNSNYFIFMSMEDSWGSTGSKPSQREQAQTEAYRQELVASYPTPDSIVEDFRHGKISQLALPLRFPEVADQEWVRTTAEERDLADKEVREHDRSMFRTQYIQPILDVANNLDRDAIEAIVGNDEWEIDEFAAKLEVSLHDETDAKRATQILQVLSEINNVADIEGSKDKVTDLVAQYNNL